MDIKAYYTVKELSKMMQMPTHTVRLVIRTLKIEYIKVGVQWLIPFSELEDKLPTLRPSVERSEIYREVAK